MLEKSLTFALPTRAEPQRAPQKRASAEAIQDPNNANGILQMYNNDGLHPNVAGYQVLGNTVDKSLFYQTMCN